MRTLFFLVLICGGVQAVDYRSSAKSKDKDKEKDESSVNETHSFSAMTLKGKLKGPAVDYRFVSGNRRDLPVFDRPENFDAETSKTSEEF